jgi:prevent-host-death family protein
MERIGARDLNQHTGQVLARVSGGESFEITDGGHPVARLVPVPDDMSILARLVASGRAVAPTSTGPVPLPPVLGDPAIDTAAIIEQMREEDRW